MPISSRLASYLAVVLWAFLLEVKMKINQYPSQEYIRSLFEYRDGGLYRLTNIRNGSNGKIGDRAGNLGSDGYRKIGIDGKHYKEHRLIWIYHHGSICEGMIIDHINRISTDNRIENLRMVDNSLNLLNRNSKNIRIVDCPKPYEARIGHKGTTISKFFYTEQEASEWIAQKKSEIFQVRA